MVIRLSRPGGRYRPPGRRDSGPAAYVVAPFDLRRTQPIRIATSWYGLRPSWVRTASGATNTASGASVLNAAVSETSVISSTRISPPNRPTVPTRPNGPRPARRGRRQLP